MSRGQNTKCAGLWEGRASPHHGPGLECSSGLGTCWILVPIVFWWHPVSQSSKAKVLCPGYQLSVFLRKSTPVHLHPFGG